MLAPELAADPTGTAAQLGSDKLARCWGLREARGMGQDLGSVFARQVRKFMRQLGQMFAATGRHSANDSVGFGDSQVSESP